MLNERNNEQMTHSVPDIGKYSTNVCMWSHTKLSIDDNVLIIRASM